VPRLLRLTRRAAAWLLILAVAAVAAAEIASHRVAPPPTAPPRPPHLAIVDVTVVDPRDGGRLFEHSTVVVEGDRILRVGPSASVTPPADAQVMDGRGRYLIPGLWDAHIHTLRLSPQLHLPLLVAHGVTAVRDLGDACSWSDDLECVPSAARWRAAIDAGTLVGPRLVEAAAFHVEALPDDPDVTVALMAGLRQRGEPFVKAQLDDEAPAESFVRLVRAAQGAGLAVAGHVPFAVDLADPTLTLRTVEHDRSLLPQCSSARLDFDGRPTSMAALLRGLDDARCARVLANLARQGTAYVPTHIASSGQDASFAVGTPALPEAQALVVMPHRWLWAVARQAGRLDGDDLVATQAFHRAALALTARARAAGVVVLAGSDALDPGVVHGRSLHDELAALVRAGLTPADALLAATAAPARHAGVAHERGTIEAGLMADLVLLSANPLDDIAHTRQIESVVAAGRVFDAPRRAALVQGVRDAAASWATASRLLRGLWWDTP